MRHPCDSARRSARSTSVELALRAGCGLWIQNRAEQNAYGSIFFRLQGLGGEHTWSLRKHSAIFIQIRVGARGTEIYRVLREMKSVLTIFCKYQ